MSDLARLGGQPVFDPPLAAPWPPVDDATERRLVELYRSRRWTAFDELEPAFAQAFAEHHGATHGIFMANGTVTLQCALGAYGIGPGDEVIVPALTWYATAMAVVYLGATPVFVDVDPDTLCIDPDQVEFAITERTPAIVPVHLYGSMADLDRIIDIARTHDLRVIEDCAHVHGGVWDGRGVGSIGDVGSFSFQHSKTMASAEGGICIMSDPEIAERIFRLKHIGYAPGQVPFDGGRGPEPGFICYPFRATAFQALILDEQLPGLDARLQRYESSVRALEARLTESTPIRFQARGRKADRQGYFGWALLFDDQEIADIPLATIRAALAAEGLNLYPTWGPVWRFNLFNLDPGAYRVHGDCPVTEQAGERLLWLLHAYLGLDDDAIRGIGDVVEKVGANLGALREQAVAGVGA